MAVDPQLTILLVEDAGTMRKMEARILNQIGLTNIIEAVDGQDAITKLQNETGIQLIISDWAMPKMDGYALLSWVRNEPQFKTIPFIMATGHSDKAYIAQAKEAGANGVVAKPFTADELKNLIDEIFGVKKMVAKKQETGPKVSKEGRVHLKMAHIQITDHLALGVLKNHIDAGITPTEAFSLETICLPGWNPVQKALEEGDVDGAFILAPAAMDLFGWGTPIKLVLFAHRNGSICVRNKQGKYVKPYQQFFKHKTFLIPHKMSIHNMLAHMYFTRMGLRPGVAGKEAINVLFDVCPPIGMSEYLKQNSDVCGFLVAEPIGSRAISAGIAEKQFLSSEIWQDHPCCVVVFRDETVNKYPEAVHEFVNQLVKAGLFMRDNLEQAAEIAVSFLDPQGKIGLDAALLRQVLGDPQGITTDNLYPVIEDLESIQQYMVNKMEIGRIIDLAKFVETKFADQAFKDLRLEKLPVKVTDPGRTAKSAPDAARKVEGFQNEILTTREGKYLIFTLAEERYGLGIMDVREIIGLKEIHEISGAPSYFKGVINLRDKVIPILDMRLKFGFPEKEYHDRTCIIIVEISGVKGSTLIGVIVDAVSEVAFIKDGQIEDPPTFGSKVNTSCILGLAKLTSGVTILLVIDQLLHSGKLMNMA